MKVVKRNNSKWRREKKIEKDCGCIYGVEKTVVSHKSKYHEYSYELVIRTLKSPCSQHSTNFQKKADKLIHSREKKTGRGYTKSPKPLSKRK